MGIVKGDLVYVDEHKTVIVDAMDILLRIMGASGVRARKIWTKSDASLLIPGHNLKYHKKGSHFTAQDVFTSKEGGRIQKLIMIEGVYYYSGFFKKAKTHKKRKLTIN